MPQGQQKLSVIEDKVDRMITKELKDIRQSLQDGLKRQEEKDEALMKEIQLLKKVCYIIINSFHIDH